MNLILFLGHKKWQKVSAYIIALSLTFLSLSVYSMPPKRQSEQKPPQVQTGAEQTEEIREPAPKRFSQRLLKKRNLESIKPRALEEVETRKKTTKKKKKSDDAALKLSASAAEAKKAELKCYSNYLKVAGKAIEDRFKKMIFTPEEEVEYFTTIHPYLKLTKQKEGNTKISGDESIEKDDNATQSDGKVIALEDLPQTFDESGKRILMIDGETIPDSQLQDHHKYYLKVMGMLSPNYHEFLDAHKLSKDDDLAFTYRANDSAIKPLPQGVMLSNIKDCESLEWTFDDGSYYVSMENYADGLGKRFVVRVTHDNEFNCVSYKNVRRTTVSIYIQRDDSGNYYGKDLVFYADLRRGEEDNDTSKIINVADTLGYRTSSETKGESIYDSYMKSKEENKQDTDSSKQSEIGSIFYAGFTDLDGSGRSLFSGASSSDKCQEIHVYRQVGADGTKMTGVQFTNSAEEEGEKFKTINMDMILSSALNLAQVRSKHSDTEAMKIAIQNEEGVWNEAYN